MRVIIQNDYEDLSLWAARYIAKSIKAFTPTEEKPFVLGLPTGSSPLGTYAELINLNKSGYVSFKHVVTFNMDEYVGIDKNHEQSYYSFMWNNFFSHIDIKRENVHILDGNAPDLEAECSSYEAKIASFGGIRLFLGGIGSDGHIAFNEPFSSLASRTRVKSLTYDTKVMNSRFFDHDINKVPERALTVGVKTVTDSLEVVILVNGHSKARALQATIEGAVSQSWTCSALQLHPRAIIVCDEPSCGELKVDTYKYFKDIEQDNIDVRTMLS
ncbi:glucosamine-6-phosphate deaminase [uncultured Sphaerochaeta sp.]|uniref:glucosamine-6-phosphate deaminase n=1 Tax=uncultured Sphaerochaeta sp. TaxID=886478 RepID=UPI002A0A8F0F|nr:glucosamine-6-phosphate deaminase [uncultured Sphaerochaeta sp.]